ncbi:hypothetical protein M0R45_017714 [Rubus argutus]|uniref:Uncharacterized protein n=1 Tax=Rubus argutus TaxID=59490 RepID=A0AAW1XVS8_RUBAR
MKNSRSITVAEQAAAGWPDWLSVAAPEAVNGWIPHRFDSFQQLDKIGEVSYSSVYKASLNSTLHRIYRLCGSPSDEDCWRILHLGSSSTAVTQTPNSSS